MFSKNEELRYIDISNFKIFKGYSKASDTVFKIKPVSVKFIKMINAKKDKDVDDNYLKKIKEYLGRIESTFCLLCNCVPEIKKDEYEIGTLFYKLQLNEIKKFDMLKKINDMINNSLDTIWCMFYEKDERVIEKVDFDMENINRLTGIIRKNVIEHACSMTDLRNLMNKIEDKIKLLNEKRFNVGNISKKEIISLKKQLENYATSYEKGLRAIATNLSDE